MCNPAKHAASQWWTQQQSNKWPHHNWSETSETTLASFTSPFTHSFHLTLFSLVAPKTCAAPPTFRPFPTLLSLMGLPLQSLIRRSSLFSPQERVPTSTQCNFWQSKPTSGGTTLTSVNVFITRRPPAHDFDELLVEPRDQMVFGDFNAHHLSWFSRTGDDRAAAKGEALDGVIRTVDRPREGLQN